MTDGMSEQEAIQSLESHGLLDQETTDYGMASETLRKLMDIVELDVNSWRPLPGDVVAGTLRDISDSTENEYGTYVILTLQTPSGKMVAIHCFHTVLRREIDRKLQRGNLRVGDEVAIKYLGIAQESTGSKNPAELYRVVVNRPQ